MKRVTKALGIAVLAASMTWVSVPGGAAAPRVRPSSLTKFYSQKLTWTKCPQYPKDRCTWVTVPLDYANSAGQTIRIRVAIHPATLPKARIGLLFTNPGGPGGWGTYDAYYATNYFSPTIVQHYDIIGIDPRGVGVSDPLFCNLSQSDLDITNGFVATAAMGSPEWAAARARIGAACQQQHPDLIAHMSTIEVAKDMDIVRGLLKQNKMNYYGDSYGTVVGGDYADLFPSRVNRFVFDGVLDPSTPLMSHGMQVAAADETVLRHFLADCPNESGCPSQLTGTVAQSYQFLVDHMNALTANPMQNGPTSDSYLTNQSFADFLRSGLPSATAGWAAIRDDLRLDLEYANPTSELTLLFGEYAKDPKTGAYPTQYRMATEAVFCSDYPAPPDVTVAGDTTAATWAQKYPLMGANLAYQMSACAEWPIHATVQHAPIHAKGAPTILVVGNTYDPSTYYAGAVSMSKSLQHSRLLTWVHDGHTAYRLGSSCVDNSIDTFLLKGKLPVAHKVCPAVPGS